MAVITFEAQGLVTYAEAVRMLGITRPTLYAWIAKGKLHIFEIGRSRFLYREEIERIANGP